MRRFLILLIILLIGAGGFLGYKYYFGWSNLTSWSFIPEDIPIVFEYESTSRTRVSLNENKVWKTLTNLEPLNQLKQQVESLDSLAGNSTLLDNLLANNSILIGFTPVSKNKFDFLVVFDIKNIDQFDAINRIIANGYKVKQRKYERLSISDIVNSRNERVFSYIFYKNFFIGSQTPFLVEDAIRTITDTEFRSFQVQQKELFQLAKLQNDMGNLYVNAKKLSNVGDVLLNDQSLSRRLNKLMASVFLDVRLAEDHMLLHGFSLTAANDFLKVFDNNLGQPMTQQMFIPNEAVSVTHISYENPAGYQENLEKWLKSNDSELWQERSSVSTKYDLNFGGFAQWMATEACMYTTESADIDHPNQTVLISLTDINLATQQIEELSKRITIVKGDSSFYEIYGDQLIFHLPISNFPALIMGPPFEGFETTYYTFLQNQLVFSDDLEAIKKLMDHMQNENVWSKSLKVNNFFEICNKESNLSYFINIPNGWRTIGNSLRPDWNQFMKDQAVLLKSFELGALQFSNVDNKYFTNLAIYHPGEYQPVVTGKTLRPVKSLELAYPIKTKPFIVRNHITNEMELLVQDSLNTLYLLNNNFEVVWDDSIGSRINTEISQVDFYKNKKLQYLFGAGNKIHLTDRTGSPVEDYPKEIGKSDLMTLQVIDYNNTKSYRWSVTNTKNQFYLTDKEGKPLKGWNPYPLAYKGSQPIKHFRIRGKDIFVTIEESGKINLLSRSGTAYKGFPLLFQDPIDNQYVITAASSFSKSILTCITQSGELMKYNLLGQLQHREQLIKSSQETRFSLLKDKNSIKYLILKQDDNNVTILESDGTERFTKNYLSNDPVQAQYYDFGAGQELIIIRDPQQEYAYLYNGNGELLNSLPIETDQDLSVLFFEREGLFRIYKVYQNEVALYEISK